MPTKMGRGRPSPPYTPTRAMRDEVELLVMGGMTQREIASAIGITVVTLEKYYRDELDHGLNRKYREVINMLRKSAERGNVAAQKKLLEIAERRSVATQLEKHIPVRLQPGKKEVAAKEAQTAGEGTKWGDFLQTGETEPKELPN